jgi:membrane-bound ClpP family serine protease
MMTLPTRTAAQGPLDLQPGRCLAPVAALLLALIPAAPLFAEERGEGLVVAIPTSWSSDFTNHLRATVASRLEESHATRPQGPKNPALFHLICDFNPDGKDNTSDTPGACLDLADYLGELHRQGVRTVAFVHGKVTRHAVLPVLTCDEIVMASTPKTQLGEVAPPDRPLDERVRDLYEKTARNRYPLALIRKMYDAKVAVLKAPAGFKGDRYVADDRNPPPGSEPVRDLQAGSTALYNFTQARDFGICQQAPRNSIDEVLEAYHLPSTCLIQPLDRIVAWRVILSGTIDGEMEEKLHRRVDWALARNANLLIFQLACSGGDAKIAARMGLYLAELNDKRRAPLETIAYVTNQAGNTAAFLALGCDKIVMQKEQKEGDAVIQPGGRLGDFGDYFRNHKDAEQAVREDLAAIAVKRHHSAVLAEGLASRDLRIYAVVEKSVKKEDRRRYLRCISEDEYRADQDKEKRWEIVEMVKPRNEGEKDHYLTLSAERAQDLKLANAVANNFEEVCNWRRIAPTEVQTAGTDWIDAITEFLCHPWTSVVLVMLGITCLILELKMPGVVMPGIIAAICFVLFFWSHSQLHGQITWLAILLFLLGLVLIGLEVFVLPGFGVAGLSGILLMLCGLGLVAYGHWPTDQKEWGAFAQHVGPFGLSILGALACAVLLAKYLPNIPYVNKLILQPQADLEEGGESTPELVRSELAELLGAIGVAATPLRPAGKVQFGDAFVDVIAEGSYVMPGVRVQVIEIEGNRVVVKEV